MLTRRLLIPALCWTILCLVTAARAQLSAPNKTGATMGHLHYHVRDIEANKKFWIALGGTPTKVGTTGVVRFPDVLIIGGHAARRSEDSLHGDLLPTESPQLPLDPGRERTGPQVTDRVLVSQANWERGPSNSAQSQG